MARTSSAAKEAAIYLDILRLIPSKSKVTSAEIRDSLQSCYGIKLEQQTLQRYLRHLSSDETFGVECDSRTRPYGYRRTIANDRLQANLSPETCLLYRLVEENLKYLLPKALLEGMKPLFDKAREFEVTSDNTGSSRKAKAWLHKVAVVPDMLQLESPAIKANIFDEVSAALFEEKWLEVSYTNRQGQKKENKLVNPLAIVQQGPCVYLVVLFESYSEVRHLALHRLTAVRKTDRPAPRPENFDLDNYLKEVQFNCTGPTVNWISLTFETRDPVLAQRLSETKISKQQKIEKTGDIWTVQVPRIKKSPLLDQWLRANCAENIRTTDLETRNPQRVCR